MPNVAQRLCRWLLTTPYWVRIPASALCMTEYRLAVCASALRFAGYALVLISLPAAVAVFVASEAIDGWLLKAEHGQSAGAQ